MRSKRFISMFLCVAVAGLLLAACSPRVQTAPPTQAPGSNETTKKPAASPHQLIVITEKGFAPATVTVKAGTNVIWSNSGKEVHSVVLAAGAKSGDIKPGGSASHVFKTAGTFDYSDGAHPDLKGVVIVQ